MPRGLGPLLKYVVPAQLQQVLHHYMLLMEWHWKILILTLLIHFTNALAFPRTAIVIYWLFALVYIGGSRFMLRGVLRKIGYNSDATPVAIYGAGSAGVQLANSLIHGREYAPMFFIDDNKSCCRL